MTEPQPNPNPPPSIEDFVNLFLETRVKPIWKCPVCLNPVWNDGRILKQGRTGQHMHTHTILEFQRELKYNLSHGVGIGTGESHGWKNDRA